MRILIWSVAPWSPTGYGRVIANLGPRLAKVHEIAYFAFTHVEGTPGLQFEGIPVFTAPYGLSPRKQWAGEVARHWKADVTLQVFDLWDTPDNLSLWGPSPLIAYTPVDAVPLAPLLKQKLQSAQYIVPMCHFAARTYEEAGLLVEDPIYHGVDVDAFRPMDRDESRAIFNLEMADFVVLMVARNEVDRKNLPAQMKAFRDFRSVYGVKATLFYLGNVKTGYGWSLRDVWEGLGGGEGFAYYDGDLPEDKMPYLYSAADVLLNATYGEGFGLPIVEAGACGTPSIATAFSSMPDLIKDRGWLVTGELAYCQQALSNWQTVPSIEEIMETLREVYDRPDEVSRRGQAMRDWVRQNLGWDKIAGQWLRLLDSVAADVGVKFPFAA